jgi:hypothetical protein
VFKLWLFALFIVASYAIFANDPSTDQWIRLSLLGFEIRLNQSGALQGLLMVARVVTVVLASQIARAGDPRAVAAGLAQLKVPQVVALSLDVVLSLVGEGGGGGGGRGDGRGRRRRHGDDDQEKKEPFWSSVKRLARGDVQPIVDRIERQIRRADRQAGHQLGDEASALRRDVSVIAGISLTMLAIKMLKLLPSLPFAPGHKLVLLTPLYIVAALLTRSRLGATLTGLVMGSVAFLMGDGRYGIFEIFKHVAPGVICDMFMPWMLRGGRLPGGIAWSAFGGLIAAGRFATIFTVTLAVQPPAVAYAILVPGLTVNVFFGVASGYVSYHLVKAALGLRERLAAEAGTGPGPPSSEMQRVAGEPLPDEAKSPSTPNDDAAQ